MHHCYKVASTYTQYAPVLVSSPGTCGQCEQHCRCKSLGALARSVGAYHSFAWCTVWVCIILLNQCTGLAPLHRCVGLLGARAGAHSQGGVYAQHSFRRRTAPSHILCSIRVQRWRAPSVPSVCGPMSILASRWCP